MHFVYIVEPDSSTALLWAHLFILVIIALVTAPLAGAIADNFKNKNKTFLFFLFWFLMIVVAKVGSNYLIALL